MIRPLATLVLMAALSGCTSAPAEAPVPEPSSSSPTPTRPSASPTRAAPPPAPPRDDSCHRLTFGRVVAPTAPARTVSCSRPHTTQTFHVGRLARVVDGRLLAVDSRRLQAQVASACPRQLPAEIGGTEEQRRLSMLRAVWFTPTVRQSDAGAAWFRCDVVALARASRLLEVTGALSGVLDTDEGRARFGMCGTAEPGTDGFARVACSLPHSWRALRTVALPGPDYPGVSAVQRVGEGPCRGAARADAPDPLDFQWGYEWPTADQWTGGQTYGICWVPAS